MRDGKIRVLFIPSGGCTAGDSAPSLPTQLTHYLDSRETKNPVGEPAGIDENLITTAEAEQGETAQTGQGNRGGFRNWTDTERRQPR
jgi:hypothetical protein